MKGEPAAKIKHYEHWLGFFHDLSQTHENAEVREAASTIADAYGYLIRCVEKRV